MKNTRIYYVLSGNNFYLRYNTETFIYTWDNQSYFYNVQDAISAIREQGIHNILCNLKGLPK